MLVKFTNNLLIKSVKFVLLPTLIIASSLLDPQIIPLFQFSTIITPIIIVVASPMDSTMSEPSRNISFSQPSASASSKDTRLLLDLSSTASFIKKNPARWDDSHKSKLLKGLLLIIGVDRSEQSLRLAFDDGIFNFQTAPEKDHFLRLFQALALEFLRAHPYCSPQGASEMLKAHFAQNSSFYSVQTQGGPIFNFQSVVSCYSADGTIVTSSQLFRQILLELQKNTILFSRQLLACYQMLSGELAEQIFNNEWSEMLLKCLRILSNSDLATASKVQLYISQIIAESFKCAEKLKSNCFSQNLIKAFIVLLDSPCESVLFRQVGKKILHLLNRLLFYWPYCKKWPEAINSAVDLIQSRHLYPLKWVLPGRRKREYFSITGVEWLPLFTRPQFFTSTTPDKDQSIFELACSIIEEDPRGFWAGDDLHIPLWSYTRFLASDGENDDEPWRWKIGKISRLMICSGGNKEGDKKILWQRVYSRFCGLILEGRIAWDELIGQLFENVCRSDKRDQSLSFQSSHSHSMQKKYPSQLPLVANEFFLNLLTYLPGQLEKLTAVLNQWRFQMNQESGIQQSGPELTPSDVIYQFTLGLLLQQFSQKKDKDNEIVCFSQIFRCLSSLLASSSASHCQAVLRNQASIDNPQLRKVIEQAASEDCNISALSQHMEGLFRLELSDIPWATQVIFPLIATGARRGEMDCKRYLAETIKNLLKYKYLRANSVYGKQGVKAVGLGDSSSEILSFLKWALKIEESLSQEFEFYNILHAQNKQESLCSALQLLEVLALVTIRHGTILPQPLCHFMYIFNSDISRESGSLIQLSRNRTTTIPAALVYLISSSSAGLNFSNAFQARNLATASRILNLYMKDATSNYSFMSSFNVYSSAARLKDYCSALPTLQSFITKQANQIITASQSAEDPKESMGISLASAVVINLGLSYPSGPQWDKISRLIEVRGKVNARPQESEDEVIAISRYLLELCEYCVGHKNFDLLNLPSTPGALNYIIARFQQLASTNRNAAVAVGVNVWKLLRVLQTLVTSQYRNLFMAVFKRCLPFIVHPCHLTLSAPSYQKPYQIGFQMMLAAPEYLSQEQYLNLVAGLGLDQALLRFMYAAVESPHHFPHLLYALRLYSLTYGVESIQTELQSLQKRINETIKTHPDAQPSSVSLLLKQLILGQDEAEQTSLASIQRLNRLTASSLHPSQFASICCSIYRQINTSGLMTHNQLDPIMEFVQDTIKTSLTPATWLRRAWACNILNCLLIKSQNAVLVLRARKMLFESGDTLSLLGRLLEMISKGTVGWALASKHQQEPISLSLKNKCVLLSLLKVYGTMMMTISNSEPALELNGFRRAVCQFCNPICRQLTCEKINYAQPQGHLGLSGIPQALHSSSPSTHYEETLSNISLQHLYPTLNASHLQSLHPGCATILDVTHDHLSLLATERYLMLLAVCCASRDVTISNVDYGAIIRLIENLLIRLGCIRELQTYANSAMKKLQSQVWDGQSLSSDLSFLNKVEEGVQERASLSSEVVQLGLEVLRILKDKSEADREWTALRDRWRGLMGVLKTMKAGVTHFQVGHYFEDKPGY